MCGVRIEPIELEANFYRMPNKEETDMKTLIIGLFGLALLASDAAAAAREPKYPQGPFTQIGAPAICSLTEGIIVIVLQKTGDVAAFACSQVNGKSITYEGTSLPIGYPTTAVDGPLGTIVKHKKPDDPDPCIEWTIGGTSYFYCW